MSGLARKKTKARPSTTKMTYRKWDEEHRRDIPSEVGWELERIEARTRQTVVPARVSHLMARLRLCKRSNRQTILQ
jgi:hypothetical protein